MGLTGSESSTNDADSSRVLTFHYVSFSTSVPNAPRDVPVSTTFRGDNALWEGAIPSWMVGPTSSTARPGYYDPVH